MKRLIFVALILIIMAIIVSLALAQSGGLQLLRSTIAGGGYTSDESGRFAVNIAIGQSVTGKSEDGGRFEVDSGYLGRLAQLSKNRELYLPMVLRQ